MPRERKDTASIPDMTKSAEVYHVYFGGMRAGYGVRAGTGVGESKAARLGGRG